MGISQNPMSHVHDQIRIGHIFFNVRQGVVVRGKVWTLSCFVNDKGIVINFYSNNDSSSAQYFPGAVFCRLAGGSSPPPTRDRFVPTITRAS